MMKCEWILCPVCGSKTRNKIRKDTVLENYPLYCPKCRQEITFSYLSFYFACFIINLFSISSFLIYRVKR
ncbi:cysteine-rich KTR domain-containing protein [Streptococcus alactolyticus]|uniref:cysteine-rich KTR domain-containing protein n=1 Tax=Streptococcus alactolyticus TaxID=29389 RepID=UPI003D068230